MKRVVTINLGGNAYQVDEDGYEALGDYLETARARLGGNPDIGEIVSDLEQAIADKLNRFLGPHKSVVSAAEIAQVLDEMGPVDSPVEGEGLSGREQVRSGAEGDDEGKPEEPRKLYRLVGDDKMLAGVCSGLAAYSGIDASIVRIIFIALAFATSGLAFIGYLVLILVIPAARTPQQVAAAYGVPFDAREVIDKARSRFAEIASGERRRGEPRYRSRPAQAAGSNGFASLIGFAILLLGIFLGLMLLSAAVSWFGPASVLRPYGGGPWMHSLPWWMVVLMLVVGIYLFAQIIGGNRQEGRSLLGSLLAATVQIFLVLLVIWLAYHMFPFVREIVDAFLRFLTRLFW